MGKSRQPYRFTSMTFVTLTLLDGHNQLDFELISEQITAWQFMTLYESKLNLIFLILIQLGEKKILCFLIPCMLQSVENISFDFQLTSPSSKTESGDMELYTMFKENIIKDTFKESG